MPNFGLSLRPQPSAAAALLSPLLALLLTAAGSALLLHALGKDALAGLGLFFVEPIKSAYAWSELSLKAAPLLLIALGLLVCFRANLWNIGAEGQFIAGAIGAGWVAMRATPATSPAIVLAILAAGSCAGAAWAGIAALLRDRFNANEILISLMLVYVAELSLGYLVYGPWKDPQGYNFPQTISFAQPTQIPLLVSGYRAHCGALVALGGALCLWLWLFRSFSGYQLQVSGLAPAAARYAGFSARRNLWTGFLLSGGLAGLAGAFEAAGPLGQLTPYVPAGYGFTAIIVAFVGRLHPLGVILSSLLLSMFYIGGELAQSRLGLPKALSGVFQGLLLFSLLLCDTLVHYRVEIAWRARAGGDA